jgi:hypothetical protein
MTINFFEQGKTEIKLPEKMSDLIDIAINDLEAVEQDPKYEIDMGRWHAPEHSAYKCSVCFAGSVMAKTFNSDRGTLLSPDNFTKWNASRLKALDEIRQYDFVDAFDKMYPFEEIPEFMDIFDDWGREYYDDNPEEFKNDMRKAAEIMRENGY